MLGIGCVAAVQTPIRADADDGESFPELQNVVRVTGEWEPCSGTAGLCIDTNTYQCSGSTLSGYCPGPSNVRCCPASYGVRYGTCTSSRGGLCKRSTDCRTAVATGLCPGPSTVTCCYPTPTPTATPASGWFLPAAPDTSGSLGSCQTPYDGLRGSCIDRSKCTGGTFNGLCSGSSSILCCVAETRAISNSVLSSPAMSLATFQRLFENISSTRAAALWPYFLDSLKFANINTCRRIASFAAQVGHESAGLLYFEELASGAAYEGRADLGNTQPGDGRRYKGRGPIQLTGRYNYRNAGSGLGRTFEANPEQVGMPSGGFLAASWFWKTKNLNYYADLGTEAAFTDMTRVINGGTNGLADRLARWRTARGLLGC